jgi:N-acetyl-anhydromuramyl-L-alanine amidase AmpD
MLRELDAGKTRVVVIVAALVAGGLFYGLRARGPVRATTQVGVALLCERMAVAARPWRMIVIHHSATPGGTAAGMDRYHRETRGWQSLAYHFVIGNGQGAADGEVEVGPRWFYQEQGAHAGVEEVNQEAIGVCLVGDLEKQVPTARQMQAVIFLTRHLKKRHGIPSSQVRLHSELRPTRCPGRLFPTESFRAATR